MVPPHNNNNLGLPWPVGFAAGKKYLAVLRALVRLPVVPLPVVGRALGALEDLGRAPVLQAVALSAAHVVAEAGLLALGLQPALGDAPKGR